MIDIRSSACAIEVCELHGSRCSLTPTLLHSRRSLGDTCENVGLFKRTACSRRICLLWGGEDMNIGTGTGAQ